MQKITTVYEYDISLALANLDKLNDRLGKIIDVENSMKRQNPFVTANQSAAQFNTTLGSQGQLYGRLQAVENTLIQTRARMSAQLAELKKRQSEVTDARQYAELTRKVADLEKKIEQVGDALEHAKQKNEGLRGGIGKVGNALKTAFTATGVLFLIDKLVEVGSKIIGITGESEKYQNQFTRIFEGNADAAKAYLNVLQKTADTTNFTFDELADNVAKLASRGITPSREELLKLGDTANFINKPFEQLNEAILDANNPERWKELGFVVTTTGDKMTLSYGNFSKTVDKSVKGAYEGIQAFAAQGKVLGSTAEAGQMLSGRVSTLEDAFSGFFRTVGQGSKGLLNGAIDLITYLVQKGTELYKTLSPAFEGVFDSIGKVASALGGAVRSLIGFDKQAQSTATGVQTFGYFINLFVIKPLTGIALIAAGAIEGFNQLLLYTEYAAARLRGKTGVAAAIDAELQASKARVKDIQVELQKVAQTGIVAAVRRPG